MNVCTNGCIICMNECKRRTLKSIILNLTKGGANSFDQEDTIEAGSFDAGRLD